MMNGNGSGNSSPPRATLESPARVGVCVCVVDFAVTGFRLWLCASSGRVQPG